MLNMEKSDEPNTYNDQENQKANMKEPSQPLPGGPQKQSKSIKEQLSGTSCWSIKILLTINKSSIWSKECY